MEIALQPIRTVTNFRGRVTACQRAPKIELRSQGPHFLVPAVRSHAHPGSGEGRRLTKDPLTDALSPMWAIQSAAQMGFRCSSRR
jgi:hypothetical protein